MLIGTNNRPVDPPSTAAGIRRICEILYELSPATRVILLPILPRGDPYLIPFNRKTNQIIKWYPYHPYLNVLFYDIYRFFIGPNGQMNKDLFLPDLLHLSPKGYSVLGDKLLEYVRTL